MKLSEMKLGVVMVVLARVLFALVVMWFMAIGATTVIRETVASMGWDNLVEPATAVFVVPAILFAAFVVAMAIEGMDAINDRKAKVPVNG